MENANNIETVEKHETEEKDELEKAMKLFGLEDKKNGRKEKND